RAGEIEADRIVMLGDTAVPYGRLDDFQFRVEVDLVEVIHKQHCRVFESLKIARRYLHLETLVWTIAQALHNLARLSAPLCQIAVVTRQPHQYVLRHAPRVFGKRHHRSRDAGFTGTHDVDDALSIDRQRHRPAQLLVVERRFTAVHDQISADARWNKLTDCLRRTRHDVPDERNRDIRHECQIKFIGREGQDARRAIADDLELDRVEIRATRLPVCRIPRQLDRRVRIECRELEWTCSDRLCAHVLRRYVAWVDWREVRCEQ